MHERKIPWRNAVISGWILDPDRKKMSKSKGNVVTPMGLFDTHSVDAVRYWASRARLGVDTALDEQVMKLGRRLANKLANAGRFALLQLERAGATPESHPPRRITHPLDVDFAALLAALVERSTRAFADFEFAPALQATEETFWDFCDNYLEIVKVRAYAETPSEGRESALATLELALRVFLRLFAPFMPYVTEEVWSWRFAADGRERSIHTSLWPSAADFDGIGLAGAGRSYDAAREVSAAIRGAKTTAKKSLRWPVARLEVRGGAAELAALEAVLVDVLEAGSVDAKMCRLVPGAPAENALFATTIELGEQPAEER
jgi:valyl-tRNA synthetase